MRRLVASLASIGVLAAPLASTRAQSPTQFRHEIIRGRVTTDSGVALQGADVIVTMAPTAETFATTSNATGEFSISIPRGTGEYLLYAGMLGRRAFKQRVTRAGADTIFVVSPKLAPAPVTTVAAVKVQAPRVRPTRTAGTEDGKGTSGVDRTADGVAGALPPELQGNLDAMALMVPGVVVTPNGISAFGLGAESNQTSLNGLAFAGGDLPRDARTATRFQLSPWDPVYGGFSGTLVSVTLLPGDNVATRRGHVTLDDPALQFSDGLAGRTGQKFSNILATVGGAGPVVLDQYFYNYGLQLSRNTAPTASLLSLDADALSHAGLAPDSAARLVQLLSANHVPLTAASADARRITSATLMERIDHAPSAVITGKMPARTWSLTGYGRYARSESNTLSPAATPASAGATTTGGAALQGIYSAYFGTDRQYLNETTTGVSVNRTSGTPYLDLPSGNVLVSSVFPDGTTGLGTAAFGGSSLLDADNRSWTWESVNQTTFMPLGLSTLPLHLYVQSKLMGYDQRVPANRLGRFDYASLADLAAGRPSAYTRTLNAPERSSGEWVGATALGGSWSRDRVVFTGGARLDLSAFTNAPEYNAAVDRAFGARTDESPRDIGVSPRLGFVWYYQGRTGTSYGQVGGNGNATTLYRGASTIRGGIGEFRNQLPATLLSDALGGTGLDDATRQLRCIGAATPTADWNAFASGALAVPTQCAGGATAFTDSAATITLFDRAYAAPRTWKGTLGWTTWNNVLYFAIDGTYALNLRQPGIVDLNFAGTPAFTIASEGVVQCSCRRTRSSDRAVCRRQWSRAAALHSAA